MSQETVLDLVRSALLLVVQLSLPVVSVAAVVGLAISVVQAATQIQESTLAIVPRILAIFAALGIFGSWMLRMAVEFTTQLYLQMPGLAK